MPPRVHHPLTVTDHREDQQPTTKDDLERETGAADAAPEPVTNEKTQRRPCRDTLHQNLGNPSTLQRFNLINYYYYHKQATRTYEWKLLYRYHTIQIYTCNRSLSIYVNTRKILLQLVDIDHSLADTLITLEPDYYDKMRLSIENRPIELPDKDVKEFLSTYTATIGKTYYPGIKHSNKYFTAGTRIYQCIKLHMSWYYIILGDTYEYDMTSSLMANLPTATTTSIKILIKHQHRPIKIITRYQMSHRHQLHTTQKSYKLQN